MTFSQLEKLRKKRSSLVGAFVSTHGKSFDDVERSIVEARTSLSEITQELQERVHRWKQIEILLGKSIINNSGLQSLEHLYRNANGRIFSLRGKVFIKYTTNRVLFLFEESIYFRSTFKY